MEGEAGYSMADMSGSKPKLDAVVTRRPTIVLPLIFFRSAVALSLIGSITYALLAWARSATLHSSREAWLTCAAFLVPMGALLLARFTGVMTFLDTATLEKHYLERTRSDRGLMSQTLAWSVYTAYLSQGLYMGARDFFERHSGSSHLVLLAQECLGGVMIVSSLTALGLLVYAINLEAERMADPDPPGTDRI